MNPRRMYSDDAAEIPAVGEIELVGPYWLEPNGTAPPPLSPPVV